MVSSRSPLRERERSHSPVYEKKQAAQLYQQPQHASLGSNSNLNATYESKLQSPMVNRKMVQPSRKSFLPQPVQFTPAPQQVRKPSISPIR